MTTKNNLKSSFKPASIAICLTAIATYTTYAYINDDANHYHQEEKQGISHQESNASDWRTRIEQWSNKIKESHTKIATNEDDANTIIEEEYPIYINNEFENKKIKSQTSSNYNSEKSLYIYESEIKTTTENEIYNHNEMMEKHKTKTDSESTNLRKIALNESNRKSQIDAINKLSTLTTESSISALTEIAFKTTDERRFLAISGLVNKLRKNIGDTSSVTQTLRLFEDDWDTRIAILVKGAIRDHYPMGYQENNENLDAVEYSQFANKI